jgi:hypothetical protein
MAKRIGMNAPVGPPIWNLDPPSKEIRIPAITVVYNPYSGLTPEAMANAIPSGIAMIPTISPDNRSLRKSAALYPAYLPIHLMYKNLLFFIYLNI